MKNKILHKALQQFQKHGIREMSNQKLVELLGISSKTIYKYFKSKEALLEEVLQFHHSQQYEMLKNLPVGQSVACLFFDFWHTVVEEEYNINNLYFRDLHYYYPELEKKIQATVANKFLKEFLRIIQQGIKEGAFRVNIIPEVVLENIFAQYIGIARSEQFKRFRLSPENIMLNTITTTIRGICTVKGAEALEEHIETRRLLTKVEKPNGNAVVHNSHKKTLKIIS